MQQKELCDYSKSKNLCLGLRATKSGVSKDTIVIKRERQAHRQMCNYRYVRARNPDGVGNVFRAQTQSA